MASHGTSSYLIFLFSLLVTKVCHFASYCARFVAAPPYSRQDQLSRTSTQVLLPMASA